MANAADVDGDDLTAIDLLIASGNGTLVDNGDGTWNYTPAANDDLDVSFSYTVTDGMDNVAGDATLDITPINDAPTITSVVTLTSCDRRRRADGNWSVTLAGTTFSIVTTGAGIRVRMSLQAEQMVSESAPERCRQLLTTRYRRLLTGLTISSGNGTLVDNGDGTWNYTPAANDDSDVSFSYIVTDGTDSVAGGATFDITSVNDAPVAVDDFDFATQEDTPITIAFSDLLSNDSDVDGDTLQIDAFVGETNGTVQSNGDGTYTFTPDADFSGVASFDYIVNDGNNATDRGTVEILVGGVNDDPLAVDDEFTTSEDTSVTILPSDLLANDSDPDGDTPQFVAVDTNSPTNGTLQVNGDGSFAYTPNANFFGSDSVTYGITDGNGGTDQATVNITVTSRNDAPTISPVTLTPFLEDSGTVTITQNDLLVGADDVDGDILSAIGLTITSGSGTLVDNLDGTWDFTPDANDDSGVSFSYDVTDENATVANTATLDITAVNDAPVLTSNTLFSVSENTTAVGTFAGEDPDGDTLTYSLEGTDSDLFNINTSTGEVVFASAPDFETPLDSDGDNAYEITVVATDDGTRNAE